MIDRVPEGDELPEDVDLMQLVAIPLRRWKWVAGVATSVVVLVVLYSLISPSMYTARTTIMPMPA
ncbi:MAG TPA: Wzz/FepE/Etk N-terminal domain-containing protein, partial [Gemmatimonadota bacterium]|nr:Wzz/FepE/Etk N-terminal domain-containing protein [Gemmatimonadota bacterium]